MYFTNILAFADTNAALKWVGLAVAIVVVAFLMVDLVINIKKRNHVKLNITALVFLVLALVGYVITQFVLTNLPAIVGFVWVAFLVAYLICDVILAVVIGKDNRRAKRDSAEDSAEEEPKTE